MPAGGGLLQLVAQGIQDIYLTGNPQMTFFKFVYKRCTNFAIESMPMYFDGTANFGQKISCLIPRKGDLLGRVYIDVLLPRLTLNDLSDTPVSYVNSIGNALIQEVSLEIGEQQIDKQTGEWMEIWEQFITPAGQRDALNNMIGKVDGYAVPDFIPGTSSPGIRLYIPLQFFFCRNPGLYLPLLAMQYHPIRINVTISPLQSLFYTTELLTNPNCSLTVNPVNITSMQLWGDYIYLDTDERRRFVSRSQEYLIEQVQYTPLQAITATQQQVNIETDFNHPIKEFFFVARRDKMNQTHEYFNYSSLATYETLPAGLIPFFTPSQVRTDLIATAKLQLDGYDRFQDRDAPYFRLVQPYEHHTFTPVERYIYCYSLALNPEQVQPSGSLNASRIDSVNWQIIMNPLLSVPEGTVDSVSRGPCTIRIYALNYNVLRVVGGYAGVLFTI